VTLTAVANEGDNQLARGEMEVGGQHLSLQDVKSDAYVVGRGERPHSAVAGLLQGDPPARRQRAVRPVQRRHVAGILNPPRPKARHEVAGKNRPTAAEWRASAESRSGSWWEGLDQMGREAAGALTTPPPLGSRRQQVPGEAPR
jgi:polyhydroxyalkanoate synthase